VNPNLRAMVPLGGADSDGDGWANEAELRVGTDPLSTNSFPVKVSFGVNFAYGTNKSSFTNIATVTEGSSRTVGTLAILDTMGRLENGNQPEMSVELGQEAQKRFELVGKELRLKTNPVCTSVEKDSYPVDVLVKDSSRSGTLTTTLTVEVLNVVPQIIGGNTSFAVDENVAIGTGVGTMQADESNVSWEIASGNGLGLFAIDRQTGQIKTAKAIDYEALSSKTITLGVTVTDVGGAKRSANVTITVGDVIDLSDWLGGVTETSELLLKYGVGGAASPTAASEATVTVLASNKLTLMAVVRTNDRKVSVVGEAGVDLSVWNTNGVSHTPSSSQASVPEGCQRRIYSVDRPTNSSRQFLRLKVTR
jgi:hypothetical protein